MSTLDLDLSPQDRQIQLGLDIKERSNSFENIDKYEVEKEIKEIETKKKRKRFSNSLKKDRFVQKHLREDITEKLHLKFKIKLVYDLFLCLDKKFGRKVNEDRKKRIINDYLSLCKLDPKKIKITKISVILESYLQNIPREREIMINSLLNSGRELRNNQNRYGNPRSILNIIEEFSVFGQDSLANRITGRETLSINKELIEFIVLKTMCYSLGLGNKLKSDDFKNFLVTFIEKIFHPMSKDDLDNIVEPIKFDVKMDELGKELNMIKTNEIQRRLKILMGPSIEERLAALRNSGGPKGLKKQGRSKKEGRSKNSSRSKKSGRSKKHGRPKTKKNS